MRTIDADALIEDLEYDVELDARQLDDMDFVGIERELVQFDKDCKQNAIDLLQHAPTIEERKWTPCSERLPEERKEVLASTIDGYLYVADYEIHNGNVYWEETTEYTMLDVLAWMPLPEPYRKDGD